MASPREITNDTQTAEDQPRTVDKFEFLEALTSSSKHGRKSFYQHLCNVYNYLKSQSFPDEVCDAGLFHSIYGTEFYEFESTAITRDVVRNYIGEYAEELVYIFCGLRQDRFGSIVNNISGWDMRQHLDLCRLEYANFWDVKENRNVQDQMEILVQKITQLKNGDSS